MTTKELVLALILGAVGTFLLVRGATVAGIFVLLWANNVGLNSTIRAGIRAEMEAAQQRERDLKYYADERRLMELQRGDSPSI